MNEFFITGSRALLYAFAEEVALPLSGSPTFDTIAYTSENTLVVATIPFPQILPIPGSPGFVFNLPNDWEKAVEYVKEQSKKAKSEYSNGDLVYVRGIHGGAIGNGIHAVTCFARLMPIELQSSLRATGMLDGDYIVYFEGEYYCITEAQIERKAIEDEINAYTIELDFGDECTADINFEDSLVVISDGDSIRGSMTFAECKEAYALITSAQDRFEREFETINSFYDIDPCLRFNFGCVTGVSFEEIKDVMKYIY